MSSTEAAPINFTVDLFEKTKDFALHTGIPTSKMSDEMVEKITKAGGEYMPTKKTWVVPHAKLCDLLDECFDYFTEESLVNISKLLDKANVDKEIKDKVREKSVSKFGNSAKKEARVRPIPSIIEENEPLAKPLRVTAPTRSIKRGEVNYLNQTSRLERPFGDRSFERSFGEPVVGRHSAFKGDYYSDKSDSLVKQDLLVMLADMHTRISKVEQYVMNNL